jgi:hypothetical protein
MESESAQSRPWWSCRLRRIHYPSYVERLDGKDDTKFFKYGENSHH